MREHLLKKPFLALFAASVTAAAFAAAAACSSSTTSTTTPETPDASEDAGYESSLPQVVNVLDNPSFEASESACAPPWQAVDGTSQLETANLGKTGTHSCRICNGGTDDKEVGVRVEVPIDPPSDGTTAYALEAFLRDLDGGVGEGGNAGRLTITPKDESGKDVAPVGKTDVPIQNGTWRSFSTSVTPKASATKLEARIGGVVHGKGCILVDDVTLYRAP